MEFYLYTAKSYIMLYKETREMHYLEYARVCINKYKLAELENRLNDTVILEN